MDNPFQTLIELKNAKEFSAHVKSIEKNRPDGDAFTLLDSLVSLRLYEPFYTSVPCTSFALRASAVAARDLPPGQQWRLFVRQAWSVAKERKRLPFQFPGITSAKAANPEDLWQSFEAGYQKRDFGICFRAVQGLLATPDATALLRKRSLKLALRDPGNDGSKFTFLALSWLALEGSNSSSHAARLFPSLHYLVTADRGLSYTATEQLTIDGRSPSGELSQTAYDDFESAVLHGTSAEALGAVRRLLGAGSGFDLACDALLNAAARAVINAGSSYWLLPVQVFHVIRLGRDVLEPGQRAELLSTGTQLLNQASVRSRETKGNRPIDDVIGHFCPTDPVGVLRSVVSHTDPHASATAVYAGIGMDEPQREELFATMVAQAIKNDSNCSCSHDVLYAVQTVQEWKRSKAPRRHLLPVSAGYLLGRTPKNYELASEYGVN